MARVEIREEAIYKKIRNSLISKNFKEQEILPYERIFSNGKLKILVKMVSHSDLSSFYRNEEEILFDFMFEIFSLLIDESYDGIILICPSFLEEQISPRVDLLKEFSKKLYLIPYDKSQETTIEVESALSFFRARIEDWRLRKESRRKEVEIKKEEKIVPKVYEVERNKELEVKFNELTLRVRNLEEKYDYVMSRLERISSSALPKATSKMYETSEVKKEEKIEIPIETSRGKKELEQLPSFFKDNPWVEILSGRGKEKSS